MTVHPDAVEGLHQRVVELHRRGISQLLIGSATGVPGPSEAIAEWGNQMRPIGHYYLRMRTAGVPFRMTTFEEAQLKEGRSMGVFGCKAGRNCMVGDVEGCLHGCSRMLAAAGLRDAFVLRNVWEGITNPAARAELTDTFASRRPICQSCDLRDECTGGCPAVNYEASGSIFEPDPQACASVREAQRLRRSFVSLRDGRHDSMGDVPAEGVIEAAATTY